MKNIIFPFQYSDVGGERVFVPWVPIKLETVQGLVEFYFLVDTGADVTTLPFFMASRLGIDLAKARKSSAEGLGGFRLQTWLVSVKLIFPHTRIKVRASITDENSTPFLLGRGDLLDVMYSWNFDARKKIIKFETI